MSYRTEIVVDPKTNRQRIIYHEDAATASAMKAIRLGPLNSEEMVPIDPMFKKIATEKIAVIVTSLHFARRLTRTRLEYDRTPHFWVTGTLLLHEFLQKADEGLNNHYLQGFPMHSQLFMVYGYFESKNKKLPELIVEMVNMRRDQGKHCWLMIPEPIQGLASRLDTTLLALSSFPTFTYPAAETGFLPVSPVVPTQYPLAPPAYQAGGEDPEAPQLNPHSRAFKAKKKKKYSR